MRGKHWLVVVGILALSACSASWWRERNCPAHEDCPNPDAPPDTGGNCGMITCEAPLVCGPQDTCVECVSHDDCKSSNLCLDGGMCAATGDVLYVEAGAPPANKTCTLEAPCPGLPEALFDSPVQKQYIKVTGRFVEDQPIEIIGRTVSIYGGLNARFERSNNGPIFHIKDQGAKVALYDLEITKQRGTGGADAGIRVEKGTGNPELMLVRVKIFDNAARGIFADGGLVVVIQSTISSNASVGISMSGGKITLSRSTILSNPGGGLFVDNADFDITNTFIAKNGSSGSAFGGLRIEDISNTGTGRFEFNTVTANQPGGVAAGVSCVNVMPSLAFRNSIVYGNGSGLQIEGPNCSWSHSDIGPVVTVVPGDGNIDQPPMFVSPSLDNFHLLSGSPAKDKAGPVSMDIVIDVDGDPRVQGMGPDMGADETR